MRKSFDVLLLLILLLARLRINAFAEAGLYQHAENIARHPWLGKLFPPTAIAAFGTWLGDPIFLILATLSILAFIIYAIIDLRPFSLPPNTTFTTKYILLLAVIGMLVILPTLKLVALRHDNLPQSYSHDGGVIQTEAAVDYFLAGRSPYIEDYRDTPMAEWGFPEFRTALDHYPYLPATFILSAPTQLISTALLGWYDQRFTYLILFVLSLSLLPAMARRHKAATLALTMIIGLNPIMGLDLIFGQNDSFVLAWIIFSLWALQKERYGWAGIFFGIACASKPTAWFLAPFWVTATLPTPHLTWEILRTNIRLLSRRLLVPLCVILIFTLPYLTWNAGAFIDDIWRWAAGTATEHYQIWGWGFANLVLATGTLADRFAYWPFGITEAIFALPLLAFLLFRQWRENTLANACWHGALLLLVFAYFSRFLNENYLGFILALLALGYFLDSAVPSGNSPAET